MIAGAIYVSQPAPAGRYVQVSAGALLDTATGTYYSCNIDTDEGLWMLAEGSVSAARCAAVEAG